MLLNFANHQPNNVGSLPAPQPANGYAAGTPAPLTTDAEFLHGPNYSAAIDNQGFADCETGQRGYVKRLNHFDPRHRNLDTDQHTPGDQGPTWSGRARVPAGQTFSRKPQIGPQTLAIVTMTFPPERRGAAFGIWGAVAGLATMAGPTLGGLLVTAFDWRWIFFVNLPIGAAVLAVTPFIIPAVQPGRRHRFDIVGVVLASLALLAICYGLVEGQRYDWGTVTSFISIPLILAVGVVLLGAFGWVEKARQDREPLVPFVLFRSRNFSLMNWVSGTLSIGMLGIFLPFTIYLQSALGFSALKAGLTMAPSSVVMIILAPILGRLTDKIGGKYILMTGLTLFAVGMGWAVLIATPYSAWYDFLAPMVVAGLGMGATFPPMTTTAMSEVDPRMAGAASGVLNTTRQVGSVIGTAAVGALLQNRLVSSLTSRAAAVSASLPPQARGPFVSGFRRAAASGLIGPPASSAAPAGTSPGLAAQLRRLGAEVFAQGYVVAMRWTMILPISVVVLAAASCLALRSKAGGQDGATAAAADSGQMAGTISSPGSSGSLGQSPGSSSGTAL